MKCFRYTYPIDNDRFFPLEENRLFLDIETTGFHRRTTFLTIIGLAWQEKNSIIIEQWFNECIGESTHQESVAPQNESSESERLWGLLEEGSILSGNNRSAYSSASSRFPVSAAFSPAQPKKQPSSPPLSPKECG
ncbi:MAG: ribonuclease H-like domain-containing protein, partial [Lachnospiraceae bacterium]|nr:ribonuclease H-like domain-containing protein [Lachnospiraceae bacterium]